MKNYLIYTDGGCHPNPGEGGWAFAVLCNSNDPIYYKSEYSKHATNNTMELLAIINAIDFCNNHLSDYSKVKIYTDSQYVKNGITVWIDNWMKNGWLTAAKKPVKNKELWQNLYQLKSHNSLNIEFKWIKGHNGNKYNEIVDEMCTNAIKMKIGSIHQF